MLFFIKELYRRYVEDEVAAYGAEMAYYFLLSIFPFLIFVTTLIGFLPIPGESFLAYLKVLLPHESYQFIRDNLLQILSRRNLKLLSFGIISMLWAASSGMGAAVRGINRALCQKDTRPFWIAVPFIHFLYHADSCSHSHLFCFPHLRPADWRISGPIRPARTVLADLGFFQASCCPVDDDLCLYPALPLQPLHKNQVAQSPARGSIYFSRLAGNILAFCLVCQSFLESFPYLRKHRRHHRPDGLALHQRPADYNGRGGKCHVDF